PIWFSYRPIANEPSTCPALPIGWAWSLDPANGGYHVTPTAAALHERDRRAKGPHGGRCLELSRSRARRAGLYRGQPLAQSLGVPSGPRRDRRLSEAQMAEGTELPTDQGSLGFPQQPHRRALPIRMARRERPVASLLRQ